jgi:hypothetical protein
MEPSESGNGPENAPKLNKCEQDPLELAQRLADEFTKLEIEKSAPGGTRERRNKHLEESYGLAFYYHEHSAEFPKFRGHNYFQDMDRKPKPESIMRFVLILTMQAKRNEVRLNRVYKSAAVFDTFYAEGVDPDGFASILKERGGVDFIYDQLCDSKRIRRFAVEDEGDEPNAPTIEALPSETMENLADDETSEADEETTDGTLAGDSIVLNVNPPSDDRVSRLAAPLPRAEFGQADEVKGKLTTVPQKEGRLDRINLETDLAVTFQPYDLVAILEAGGALINVRIEEHDGRNWAPVQERIVRLFPRDEDQLPDSVPPPASAGNGDPSASQPNSVGDPAVALEAFGSTISPCDSASPPTQPASPPEPAATKNDVTTTPGPKAAGRDPVLVSTSASKASPEVPHSVGKALDPTAVATERNAPRKADQVRVQPAKSDKGRIAPRSSLSSSFQGRPDRTSGNPPLFRK